MFILLYNNKINRHNKILYYINKYIQNKPQARSNNNIKEIVIITKSGYQLFGLEAFCYIIKKILFK